MHSPWTNNSVENTWGGGRSGLKGETSVMLLTIKIKNKKREEQLFFNILMPVSLWIPHVEPFS